MPFFLLFVIIPVAEIIVFMNVSDAIGLGTTFLMALITAVLGGIVVRYQGLQTLMTAQNNLRQGILPSNELFDGLCIVAAGATLITPGFITDTIGFALLIPALRKLLRKHLSSSGRFEASGFHDNHRDNHSGTDPFSDSYTNLDGAHNSNVIEAEYERVDDDNPKEK